MKPAVLVFIVILSGILYIQWELAPQAAPAPPKVAGVSSTQDSAAAPPAESALEPLPPRKEFEEIVSRTLFSASRRPEEEEPKEAPVVTLDTQALKVLTLSAIMITPKGRIALLRDRKTGETLRAAQGESLRGWDVSEVAEGAIRLQRREQSESMVLRDYSKPVAVPRPAKRQTRTARLRNKQRQQQNREQQGRGDDARQMNKNP